MADIVVPSGGGASNGTEGSAALSSGDVADRRSSASSSPGGAPILSDDVAWVALALAAALPLIGAALPRDQHGCCVMPHPHPLAKRTVRGSRYINVLGRTSYVTNRACDNCDEAIADRVYYACAEGCEVDFCKRCYEKLEELFTGLDLERTAWVAQFVSRASTHVLMVMRKEDRRALARELAFTWPTQMFERLTRAVVDVADAKVVHLPDNSKRVKSDTEFWCVVGFLQLLYAASLMPASECRFGELVPRGPRIPRDTFILAGIDKCDAEGEWERWAAGAALRAAGAAPASAPSADAGLREMILAASMVWCASSGAPPPRRLLRESAGVESSQAPRPTARRSAAPPRRRCVLPPAPWELVLDTDHFEVTDDFASFLTHSNLVPSSFWQRCIQEDVYQVLAAVEPYRGRVRKLYVEVRRDPESFPQSVVGAFGRPDWQHLLARPIAVRFHGEPASGPGVNREFLRLAILAVLHERFPTAASARLDASPPIKASPSGATTTAWLERRAPCPQCGGADGSGSGAGGARSSAAGSASPDSMDGAASAAAAAADVGQPLWECDPELRTYWFRAPGPPAEPMAMRALGALIGQALLSRQLLPAAFPPMLFELLLRGIRKSRTGASDAPERVFGLTDMAAVCPAIARSLEKLIEYDEEDVAELFTLDWPGAHMLRRGNREAYVQSYVQWYFTERYAEQLGLLVEGFRTVVGCSALLRTRVDATQLERILCGAERPVDIAAIRAGAVEQDWKARDREYLDTFWEVLQGLSDSEKRSFVVFVSACGRTPPRGWQDLGLCVQKHGSGDDRLPTAFTCFCLLMLPRYSCAEVLRARLRRAITDTEGFGLS